MTVSTHAFVPTPAVVARPPMRPTDADQYLMLSPQGAPSWTTDPHAATAFESMKEAMRAALRLPSSVRAFGLPLRSELGALALH
jgi:hypothetical protein